MPLELVHGTEANVRCVPSCCAVVACFLFASFWGAEQEWNTY